MDNLAKDAFMARQKGMSYGRYMATKKPGPVKKSPINSGNANCYCARCGKSFVKQNKLRQKYCSDMCYRQARSERELERYRRSKSMKTVDE